MQEQTYEKAKELIARKSNIKQDYAKICRMIGVANRTILYLTIGIDDEHIRLKKSDNIDEALVLNFIKYNLETELETITKEFKEL